MEQVVSIMVKFERLLSIARGAEQTPHEAVRLCEELWAQRGDIHAALEGSDQTRAFANAVAKCWVTAPGNAQAARFLEGHMAALADAKSQLDLKALYLERRAATSPRPRSRASGRTSDRG